MTNEILAQKEFKGIRNDIGQKHIGPEYFYRAQNVNYDSIIGADQILCPDRIKQIGSNKIDGLYLFRYLDQNSVLQQTTICVTNGSVYKDALVTPTLVYSGLTPGKVSFSTYKDKLFMTNGKDYPFIYEPISNTVYQMGAPLAVASSQAGNPSGTYRYAITYITTGGEEVVGTVSNEITIFSAKVNLTLPLGYSGVTNRKIYRTVAGGTALLLLATLGDNTTLTYLDNSTDASLGAPIPDINNEMPKPYFFKTSYSRLVGCKVDKYPTQAFVSDTDLELFDLASAYDISNIGDDNTSLVGMEAQFAKIVIASQTNWYILDCSTSPATVRPLSVNVGAKDGWSIINIPQNINFPGGVMYVTTLNTIGLLNGIEGKVLQTIDNIASDNWAQQLRGSLSVELLQQQNIHACFFDYKYHLLVGSKMYVFDIRTLGWSEHVIKTTNYQSTPYIIASLDSAMYNGQLDGWIEKQYTTVMYRGESITSILETGLLLADNNWKRVYDVISWFISNVSNNIKVEVLTDENINYPIFGLSKIIGGAFSPMFFSRLFYNTGNTDEDYRVLHINRNCRWFKIKITCDNGRMLFRGFTITGQLLEGEENA